MIKKTFSVSFFVFIIGCSPYSTDKLVRLPTLQTSSNNSVLIINNRPEIEKVRKNWSGGIYVVDDRQFSPSKMDYLKARLAETSTLRGKTIEVTSFKHTLDTRVATSNASAIAKSSAVAAQGANSIASQNVGKDSIQCSIKIKIDGKEYSAESMENFVLGPHVAHEYERKELREATLKVTDQCIGELINKIS